MWDTESANAKHETHALLDIVDWKGMGLDEHKAVNRGRESQRGKT